MSTIDVEVASPSALAEIAEFYKSAGYGGGVSGADVTLVARMNGRLLGAVRLCTEAGVVVLRGMQVASAFQGKGIGRTLLDRCLPYLDGGVAYCLPYEHLAKFYGQAGFAVTPPELLPPFLAERLASYGSTHRPTLAMRRMPS